MKFSKLIFTIITILSISTLLKAQLPGGLKAQVEIQAIGTTNKTVPFWMRSNQYGSIPLKGFSGSLLGSVVREYGIDTSRNKKLVDWGLGFEGRVNVGSGSNIQVIESYLKGRLSIFQLKVGRTKDVMGLNGDTALSSGNFAVSGNALGVPKIELSIPNYWRIPLLGSLFSIKGNFAFGWVGSAKVLDSLGSSKEVFYIQNTNPQSYLHQKSLYVKFGKKDWKLQLYGGFNHQVFWGSEKEAYGSNFKLSPLKSFFYVVTGKAYGARGVPTSKLGNQLGSIDLGIEYKFSTLSIIVYRQFFYDVGALSKLANVADGLTGFALTNNKKGYDLKWKKVLFEVFLSKNQAGYPWSIPTKSGDEDYYNNFYYLQGWSYKQQGIGNPLITPKHFAEAGQAQRRNEFFINNRVVAVHFGLDAEYKTWMFMSKITHSWNYGTFGTSIYGGSTGSIRNPQTANIFKSVKQYSLYLKTEKKISSKYAAGFSFAIDHGKLLPNSDGISVHLINRF